MYYLLDIYLLLNNYLFHISIYLYIFKFHVFIYVCIFKKFGDESKRADPDNALDGGSFGFRDGDVPSRKRTLLIMLVFVTEPTVVNNNFLDFGVVFAMFSRSVRAAETWVGEIVQECE